MGSMERNSLYFNGIENGKWRRQSNQLNKKPKHKDPAVLTAYSMFQIQCGYIPAESLLHTKEPGKCNILPSLNVWSLLSFPQGLGIFQLKYSMPLKHSREDKHATGISSSMLKTTWHCKRQKCHIPKPWFLCRMMCTGAGNAPQKLFTYWLHPVHQEHPSVTQDFLHGCRTLSRKPWHTQWALGIQQDVTATAHTASTGLSRGTKPPGSTWAENLMLPHANQNRKVTPVHASPSNTEVGDANLPHTTSTSKSPPDQES